MYEILILEDTSMVASMMKKTLEQAGHHVESVTTVSMAEEYARKHLVDLVVADNGMFRHGGNLAIQRFQRVMGDIPLLLIASSFEDGLHCMSTEPILAKLAKPFSGSDLSKAVSWCLTRRETEWIDMPALTHDHVDHAEQSNRG